MEFREPGRHTVESARRPPATAGSVTRIGPAEEAGRSQAHTLGGGHHSRGWYLEQQRKSPVVARQQNRPARPRGSSQATDSEHHEHSGARMEAPLGQRPRHAARGTPCQSIPSRQAASAPSKWAGAPGQRCGPRWTTGAPGNVFLQGRTHRENLGGSVSLWWLIS